MNIPNPTPQEVDRYLRTHSCGLRVARCELKREKMRAAVARIRDVNDAKLVLRAIVNDMEFKN